MTDEDARRARENELYLRKLRNMVFFRPDTPVEDIVQDTLRRAGIDPDRPDEEERSKNGE